jgi:hypothetical protein
MEEQMRRARLPRIVFAAAATLALALPASAARWVSSGSDPWFWIDLDRVETRGDGRTYFAVVHSAQSGVAPDVGGALGELTSDLDSAIDCGTSELITRDLVNRDAYFEDETGTVQPEYAWVPSSLGAERRAELKAIVCTK